MQANDITNRLPAHIMNKLLKAPCVYCGYNGEGYWQKHTHHENCPFYNSGGEEGRYVVLEQLGVYVIGPDIYCRGKG
jgi:hypothetical protein